MTSPSHAKPIDEGKMLDSIRQVENWDGKTLGAKGEWGPWQMTPGVFHDYIRTPVGVKVRTATKTQLREAAVKHLAWLFGMLSEHHLPVTPYAIGLAWGAGFEAVRTNSASPAKRDYAQRCENLYLSLP